MDVGNSGHDADMHDVCSWHSPSKTLLASPRESGEGSGPCRPATFNPKGGTCSPYLIRFDPAPPYHLIGFPKPWPPGASAVARYGSVLRIPSPIRGSFQRRRLQLVRIASGSPLPMRTTKRVARPR